MVELGKLRRGDHQYFQELIKAFGPLVLKICLSYSSSVDDAEDLFQDVWIQVFRKRRSFRGEGSFEGWLNRIAHNLCRSDHRTKIARKKTLDSCVEKGAEEGLRWKPPDPGNEMERQELHEGLLRAVSTLPERERVAICLRFLEDKTPGEVAEIMGTEKATVRSSISRGIRRLRKVLRGAEE